VQDPDYFVNLERGFYSARVVWIIWCDFPIEVQLIENQFETNSQEMRSTFHRLRAEHHLLHSTKSNAMRGNFFLDFHKTSELLCDYGSD